MIKNGNGNKDYINDYEADVYDLEISQDNFEILMERIENMSELSTFRRILFDFGDFLTPELRKRVISIVRDVFGEEIIEIWNIEM